MGRTKKPGALPSSPSKAKRIASIPSKKMDWDQWLTRASLISQPLLFLLTLGTIYYTVIPLYQKALLDEQIAEKQVQLNRMRVEVDALYVKLRLRALGAFVFSAGAECSGLLVPIDPPSNGRQKKLGQDYAKLVLAIEPKKCIVNALSSTKVVEELKEHDRVVLRKEAMQIAAELEPIRQAALKRYERAERTVSLDPSRTDPSLRKPGSVARIILETQKPEVQRDLLRGSAIEQEQDAAAMEYGEKVRERVSQLYSVKWPAGVATGL